MGRERAGSLSKTRLRNLKQYRDFTDEQFDEIWDKYSVGIVQSSEYEGRIQRKIDEFGEDYDLDDLKANDRLSLRALAQAYITLEDYENMFYAIRQEGIDLGRVVEFEKISNVMSALRRDISKLQDDLNITRRVRKSGNEENVISELERLKTAAREFYEQKLFYIYCPKCKMLLANAWFHYPDSTGNKLQVICQRDDEFGGICGEKVQITSRELLEKQGSNITEDIPESMK